MSNDLNVFYDLQVSPSYFDFMTFLQIAELHRIRYKHEKMNVIFVPGPNQGFRHDTLRTPENNALMMRNVLIPACHLVKSCSSVNWLPNRETAHAFMIGSNGIFPRNYSVETPVAEYLEPSLLTSMLRGERLSLFTAPEDYQKMAKAYLSNIAGDKKVITLTLRESPHDDSPRRRANIPEWDKFFKEIDRDIYQPIIVRDTVMMFANDGVLSDYPHSTMAANNLLFRTALYQQSYINCFMTNGPFACSRLSGSNTLKFKLIDDTIPATSTQWWKTFIGVIQGEQMPVSQQNFRYAWDKERDDDNADSIHKHFSLLAEAIESGQDLTKPHGITNPQQAATIIETVLTKHIFNKFQRSVATEDLKALKAIFDISQKMNFYLDFKELIQGNEGKLITAGTYETVKYVNKQANIGLVLAD
ncbi:MAG: hypothetical protein JKY66_08425 [Spongiibacteraceae bacterium]|nr:hypothetical protein [Spongiibacteraceae bacterium]